MLSYRVFCAGVAFWWGAQKPYVRRKYIAKLKLGMGIHTDCAGSVGAALLICTTYVMQHVARIPSSLRLYTAIYCICRSNADSPASDMRVGEVPRFHASPQGSHEIPHPEHVHI